MKGSIISFKSMQNFGLLFCSEIFKEMKLLLNHCFEYTLVPFVALFVEFRGKYLIKYAQ